MLIRHGIAPFYLNIYVTLSLHYTIPTASRTRTILSISPPLKKLLEQYAQEAFSSLDFNQLYPYLRSINRISDDERMHCHTIHDDTWPNIRFVPNHKITYKNSSLR